MNRRSTLVVATLAALALAVALPVGDAAAQAKKQAYYVTDIAPADPVGWAKRAIAATAQVGSTRQAFQKRGLPRSGQRNETGRNPSARPTAWLGMSNSNFDVQGAISSL